MSPSAATLLGLALLSLATPALAAPRRVAVLKPDLELLRALDLALSPWGVETVQSDAPPASSAPDAIRIASGLATELHVEAVVWISRTTEGALLWVFDADTDEVSTRMLATAPPFDGAAAAAVALSVKTVLRATTLAPPAERFGAPPARPPGADADAEYALALEMGAALSVRARDELEPRFDLAPVLWLGRYFGLSVEASAGPGVGVKRAEYRGRYHELVLGGEARLRVLRSSALSASVSLGASAHWATLRGAVDGSPEESVRRLNASLDAEAYASIVLGGGVYLGASGGLAYFPVYRRYLVRGAPILTPGPFGATLGGYLGVEID